MPAASSGSVEVKAGVPVHAAVEKTVNVTAPVGAGAPAGGARVAVSWNAWPRAIGLAETALVITAVDIPTVTISVGSPHAVVDGAKRASPL